MTTTVRVMNMLPILTPQMPKLRQNVSLELLHRLGDIEQIHRALQFKNIGKNNAARVDQISRLPFTEIHLLGKYLHRQTTTTAIDIDHRDANSLRRLRKAAMHQKLIVVRKLHHPAGSLNPRGGAVDLLQGSPGLRGALASRGQGHVKGGWFGTLEVTRLLPHQKGLETSSVVALVAEERNQLRHLEVACLVRRRSPQS